MIAALMGCEDEFLTGSAIVRMRLLGAQLTVDGDPERAWLRPGDNGRVSFKVAHADNATDEPRRANPMNDVRSMILSCTLADIGTGQPQCLEVLDLFDLYNRYQAGEFDVDAGTPDGGMPERPIITDEQIEATFAALQRGVGCDDRGDIGDPNNPDDDVPDYFGNARNGIRLSQVTPQAADLTCVDRAPGVATSLAADYVGPDRLIQGVICEYGEPFFTIEAPYFGCRHELGPDADPSLPNRAPIAEIFFYTVGVEREGRTNRHPKFAESEPLSIATGNPASASFPPWAATTTTPIPDDCAGVVPGGDVIVKNFGDSSRIRVRLEAMRELSSTMPERREVYQVETFSSFGELERQYSVYDDLDVEPVIEVEWEHGARPREDGALSGGKRVDFHFLIRDGRGGFAYETRQLCLCPNTCPTAR